MSAVGDVRKATSIDLEDEIKVLPQEKRHILLKDALPVTIPIDHTLAMKSSLSISWNKLRALRRYVLVHVHTYTNCA